MAKGNSLSSPATRTIVAGVKVLRLRNSSVEVRGWHCHRRPGPARRLTDAIPRRWARLAEGLHVLEHASQICQFLTTTGIRVQPMPANVGTPRKAAELPIPFLRHTAGLRLLAFLASDEELSPVSGLTSMSYRRAAVVIRFHA